jgi:hypothetical protein
MIFIMNNQISIIFKSSILSIKKIEVRSSTSFWENYVYE